MTRIQRQYSLPNCTLLLDGMDDPTQANAMDLRPVMALLLNAECRIGNGYGDVGSSLVGGREFFESLVNSVSRYAQEFLSGIHLPTDTFQLVQMKRSGLDQHELSYQPSPDESNPNAKPEKLNLSTVQFFDLVEAIDQFAADTQTLPAFSLNLSSVAKKFVPRAIMGKQAVPAAIGLSGLAIAALAMFSLPIPTVKQPETLRAGVNSGLPVTPPSPTTSTPPSATISPTANPSASPDADTKKIETDLTTPSAITDPAEIDRLRQQLKTDVMDKLKQDSQFPEPLVYRVSVGKDGQVVGYKSDNDLAEKKKGQTPLPDLLLNATPDKKPEALADYRVIFQTSGRVDVVPWSAEIPAASASSNPIALASPAPTTQVSPTPTDQASPAPTPDSKQEITDGAALEALQPKLYEQLDKAWQANPAFNEDLRYRVQVSPEGTIVSYTPENNAARDYVNEIPLPKLSQGQSGNPTAAGTASFKVVFRPSGKLEINPWFGYNKP